MKLIAIGSNLVSPTFGLPIKNCIEAVRKLSFFFNVIKISKWYKSEPIPKSQQPWFINGLINVETNFSPEEIMKTLLKIENEFGRLRSKKNEARIIDLDLIDYDNLIKETKFLTLPHPRMHERLFVLRPLNDISSTWKHPILKKSVKELIRINKKNQSILKYQN